MLGRSRIADVAAGGRDYRAVSCHTLIFLKPLASD